MKSILLAAAFLGSLCWAGTNPYNIIPEPVNVTTTSGTTKNLKIVHEQKVAGLGNEGYAMKLTPGGVELRYTTPNGKAMAMATLFQLQDQLSDTPEGLPCGSIQDSPDFGWRGMMVDVGRYHYPMKEIYNFVDAMHYYKYNVLHLHLTEDQGWRLPVPGYDKLRTIGAVRPSAPESPIDTKGDCAKRGCRTVPIWDRKWHCCCRKPFGFWNIWHCDGETGTCSGLPVILCLVEKL